MALNDTLDQMDLTDIFKTFHPKAVEYTFISSAQNRSHTGTQISPKEVQKIEIRPYIFSDHSAMKLEINHKKKFGKVTNTWRLKNEWANEAVKDEIKKYMEVNENDNTTTQNLWDAAKVVKRGSIAIQAFLKKEERSQIHNLTLHLKELDKEQQIKPKTAEDRK